MKSLELGGIGLDRYLQRKSDSGVLTGNGHFPAGIGEHTDVLLDELGYSSDEIQAFKEARVTS